MDPAEEHEGDNTAHPEDGTEQEDSTAQDQPKEPASSNAAIAASSKDAEQENKDVENEEGKNEESVDVNDEDENRMDLAKWWKVPAPEPQYPTNTFYYQNIATPTISQWDEPDEPHWLWDPSTGAPVPRLGLGYKGQATLSRAETFGIGQDKRGKDAAFFERMAAAERMMTSGYQNARPASQAETFYQSTMATNRFTGNTQAGGADAGPERHSDAAKSARQMGAYFDVEAAEKANEGRSLKAERRAHKPTKGEIKEWRKIREQKKKRRLQSVYS